jgi:uncharacterized circularly permuted ATP-grasp superfamily protein
MDAIERWTGLLRPGQELSPDFTRRFAASMRERKLTFGERVHCPFLRPFFLTAPDEARIRRAAETTAALGERVVRAALERRDLFDQLGITEAEERLIRIDPGYATASTASRVDAFLLPDSLHFAEYNAESPAGVAYTEKLAELFTELDVMQRFRAGLNVRHQPTIGGVLKALLESYHEWGGTANPPVIAIVDWREVPTWTEFELLRDAFVASGVPTIVCDPRDLRVDRSGLRVGDRRIDLVYRRVLLNDIVAREGECKALVDAYEAGAVCVANTLRCKLAHKKAFFAVLTDSRNAELFSSDEQEMIARHVPWTRVLADRETQKGSWSGDLMALVRRERESLVLKPNDEYGGKGVLLGWEAGEREWDDALQVALKDRPGTWIVQERIPVRREVFPQFDGDGNVTMGEMLVDFAPYLFRGRMTGYLTRLSATGLANVTSGGGQVPAFVVDP